MRAQKRQRTQARATAQRIAHWLQGTYGVDRVVLFGSIANDEIPLGPRSDTAPPGT